MYGFDITVCKLVVARHAVSDNVRLYRPECNQLHCHWMSTPLLSTPLLTKSNGVDMFGNGVDFV